MCALSSHCLTYVANLGIFFCLFVGVLSLVCGVLYILFPKPLVKLNELLIKLSKLLVKINEWEMSMVLSNSETRKYRMIIGVFLIAASIFIFTIVTYWA